VSGRQDADFGRQRAKIAGAAAVDAQAFVDDALTDQLLGQAANSLFDLALAAGERSALAAQRGTA